jgi:phenylpropionate dioxygenase-like ring-hydroxylating dioxygenase large terminal subunit
MREVTIMDSKRKADPQYAGPSYQDLLDRETNPVPDSLRDNTRPYLGSENISVDRYLSREFHELEVEKVWKKTWQMVCRETELPNPGDTQVYDITRFSIIVTRLENGELAAHRNVCRHRGRQLVDKNCNKNVFVCPYHAFTWNLDGSFKGAPCQWDFDHVDPDQFSLPPVQVDTWGGWVFINMDMEAESLHDYLGVLPEHFKRWKPEERYKVVHVQKVIPCNWKVGWEAFIESYHAVATHPQILPYTADAESQYDVWEPHISRTITAMGEPSSHRPDTGPQDVADAIFGTSALVADGDGTAVPEGVSAREYVASKNREEFAACYDDSLDDTATNAEMMDSILYSVFPNFAPWAGFHPHITYRFRPNGDDHETALMEIILLAPFKQSEERPADMAPRLLGEDELFSQAPELGERLGTIFDQDLFNMPKIQAGMHNLPDGEVVLANYHEVRIRHFHQTLDKYIYG